MLAPYASFAKHSKGRRFPESIDGTRDCYQRDRDRIIHSSLFRKLMYKTQVFVNYEGDYYRTRLTHSLEVAQIARSIARRLQINEDLTETLALAHDVGHPPFGHAGEDGLVLAAGSYYKFDHNAQAIRALTELETQYTNYNGLNLTWETIEGLTKHNGPVNDAHQIIAEYNLVSDLDLKSYSSLEAQVAAISDDIAYNAHDLDDGLRAKLILYEDIRELPIVGEKIKKFEVEFQGVEKSKIIYKSIRKMIGFLINDVIETTLQNIGGYKIQNVADIRGCNKQIVHFSVGVEDDIKIIRGFLHKNLYHDYRVNRIRNKVKKIIKDLFDAFYESPKCMPDQWREKAQHCTNDNKKAQIICDFIAGMTDRFAIKEHQRLFDTYTLMQFGSY